jgi:hypothetical protein
VRDLRSPTVDRQMDRDHGERREARRAGGVRHGGARRGARRQAGQSRPKKDRRPEGIIIVLLKLIVWFMVRVEVFFLWLLLHLFTGLIKSSTK